MRHAPRLLPALALAAGAVAQEAPDFNRDVQPLLSRRCYACHGPDADARKAGLRLDTREGALEGALVPGDPASGELLARVTAPDDDERMPPPEAGARLAPEEVDVLERWIAAGAAYERHWSFVPPERPEPPEVSDPGWTRNPIDAFVLARLDEAGLAPAEEADTATLARRVSLDLVGLPPAPERVRALVEDPGEDAYERYVDELLASPHFGERWARVWLDVARYADSAGYGSDPLRTIWRYRDWVIDAFDANQSYDEFTRDQLAGDLLPEPTLEQRLATAFHRNTKTNTEGGTDDEEFRVEAVRDRADTTMQAWMGLTFGCAKCHSHKYDPISIEEYYSLYAFFDQTADTDKNDDRPRLRTPTAEQAERLAALEAERDEVRERLAAPLGREGLEAWIAAAAERERRWRTLTPDAVRSEGGATLTVGADGTLSASGPAPERDTYALDVTLPAGRWTGLALEALPADGLPGGGPGRSPGNGNFVLSDVVLERPAGTGAPASARHVRVELPGEGRILSLAEVQVFAGEQELARGRPATQSSVSYGAPAPRAVDGDTGGVFEDGSVTHTRTEADPWWEVDLGREVPVERVVLWNRTDGALHRRLDGALVRLLDAERRTVWSGHVRRAAPVDTTLDLSEWAEELLLAEASADFAQQGWPAAAALDADPEGTGWAVAPRVGEAHRAALALAQPLELAEPAGLVVRLRQGFGTAHTLGRFRLLLTDFEEGPVRVPPADVAAALAALPECNDEERTLLAEHARRHDPARAELRREAERLERAIEDLDVVTTPVMVELPPEERRATHVLRKGNFLQPGEEVEADVPAAFHPWPEGAPRNRLGLARWLTHPDNPLTARVAVNRWWMTLFGHGIVATQEDFGRQGTPPSHPDLLDWLAVEYVESGWDTKALLRTIVTSATYRQSSRVRPRSLARDPDARLYSRMPRVPLEAEQVRDQALAVSGLLSRKLHGPSVFPPQPPGLWQAAFNGQRDWRTSAGEERYRRGLYVFWRRTVPYPSMEVFDAPSRETCTLRRVRTNTPLQAFVTLNDPVYVECAQALARRMLGEGGEEPAEVVARGFELCLLRPPTERERELLLGLYVDAVTELARRPLAEARTLATEPLGPLEPGTDPRRAAAWTAVASVLLNQDAFLVKE